MSKRPSIKTSSIVAYIILSVSFISMALWLYDPQDRFRIYFPLRNYSALLTRLLFLFGILNWLALVNAFLQKMNEKNRLPGFLGDFYERDFFASLKQLLGWIRAKTHSARSGLVMWSAFILLATGSLSMSGVLDNWELRLFQLLIGRSIFYPPTSYDSPPSPAPVVSIALFSGDNNTEQYLKVCLRIVHELKRSGAKAVLVDARSLLGTPHAVELFKELNGTGIVVFGFQRGSSYRIRNIREGQMNLAMGFYTMAALESWRAFIPRIYPFVTQSFSYGYTPSNELDVSLALLKKYHGYSDTLMPSRDGQTISFGEYRIPVMSDGSLFVMSKDRRYVPEIGGHYGLESDTLVFTGRTSSGKIIDRSQSFDVFADQCRGKMVMISWNWVGGSQNATSYWTPRLYSETLKYMIGKEFIVKNDMLGHLISLAVLALAYIVCVYFRPFLAMQVLFFLSIGIFIFGYWLFISQHILVDILYSCVASLLLSQGARL
ncbi:MAG: hypothetical protein HW374_1525 [Bacteroidetes bacterium]|nr:hypothetical protein [Bacteroidota bacterium]